MNAVFPRRQAVGLLASTPLLLLGRARAASGHIDELGFVPIGGIEQWIGIQGRDVANPVILFLHGGPAEAQSPLLKQFIPWQTDFTVVNWDQRGAGKTFGRNGASTPGMSTPETALDRMCEDVREVAEYACRRLEKKKVILIGHSWGTALGRHAVKRWPRLFHAFVGTGQFVNWSEALRGQTKATREQAIAANDQAALQEISETAQLPETDMRRIIAANKYRWPPADLEYMKIQQEAVGNDTDWINGGGFSLPKLLPAVFSYDARKVGPDIPLPFFVIHGRDDRVTPADAAEAYVAEVRAPVKKFIPIRGGHYACFTDSEGFLGALRRHVRPLT